MRTEHLLHLDTLSDRPIARPFRVGLRNSAVALAAIGVGGVGYLFRFAGLHPWTAWWVWPAVAAGAVAVCFGHAYLGARIGGRRANSVALLVLFACFAALILWLNHATDAGHR